jgi:putative heme-binding domain-containing protein
MPVSAEFRVSTGIRVSSRDLTFDKNCCHLSAPAGSSPGSIMLFRTTLNSARRLFACLTLIAGSLSGTAFGQELLSADPESIGLDPERLSAITSMLEEQVQRGRIAGAVAVVARNGRIGYFEAVGQQDPATKTPMQQDSIFRIASMTKAITSAAIMQLVERGAMELQDPVSKHLPEFAAPQVLESIEGSAISTRRATREPTIHDLLTHRSGLTYGWFGPEKLDAIYRSRNIPDLFIPIHEPLADRVQRIAEVPLKFEPGTAWDYSVATDVLGRVVEVASGQTLQDYFVEHLLNPLQMHDTHFALPQEKAGRLAGLYTVDADKQLLPVGTTIVTAGFLNFTADYCLQDNTFYSGGGGLVSTAGDYLRFLQMLLNGGQLDGAQVLKPASVALMTQNQIGDMQIPFPGHGDGFGLGFGVLTERGAAEDDASIGTFSWGGIFDTYYWADPQQQLIGVLMTQVFPNDHLTTRADFKRLTYESVLDRVHLVQTAHDESAGGLECYRIATPTAVYYLDKAGAGLSSIIDRDGNDWLGFRPDAGSGAAGEYRGFPNAVFKEAGSYFHPRNSATDPCVTIVEEDSPSRVVISALASNGQWAGQYTFTPECCTFTMTRKPQGHNYWVLYEGTPGGQYDDSDWWMTSSTAERMPLTQRHQADLENPEWIAFGDANGERALVLFHHEDDNAPDYFYQMERQMTVFGFGRNGMQKHLATVPQSFSIGLIDDGSHDSISEQIKRRWRVQSDDSGESVQTTTEQKRRALQQFALTNAGDAERGRKLFAGDERTKCVTCHVVQRKGGKVGPDLSRIGGKFDRPHLIESLLEPSRQIVEGYRTSLIVTDEGQLLTGIVKQQDEQSITMVDAAGKELQVDTAVIDEHIETSVSLMPTGLADALTPQEFTDLVAYLETLRTGKQSFGSGVTGPIELPDGFEIATLATGLSGATAMTVAPDGRIFFCEQHGVLRIVKDGQLLERPFLTIPVEHYWERGLIGVTVSPNFPADPWVYVVYVSEDPYTHHRISRFRADGDVAVAGSEQILLQGDDQSQFGGNVPAGHQGGAIHFGNDGRLYIGIGEQTAKTPAQRMDALQGKLLRINPDGSIPDDNPFLDETAGKYRAIWAKGCRNPFTFAVRRATGEILINDVGGKFEEINRGVAGANYGWPTVDHGPTDRAGITSPIHIYPQASISGGDFSDTVDSWPTEYRGKYFFADFVHGWIRYLDPNNAASAVNFATGLRRIVDIRFGQDGSLYVLLRNAWVVDDKFEGGTGALMQIRYRANEVAVR